MFFNNKFNTFFGLNLTLVYTFPMCMTWRFHFPLRNYDFNGTQPIFVSDNRLNSRLTGGNDALKGNGGSGAVWDVSK